MPPPFGNLATAEQVATLSGSNAGAPANGQTSDSNEVPSPRRRDLGISIVVLLVSLVVYNANLRSVSAGDAYPARYLPFAIWKHRTVLLDPIASITAQGRGATAFWMVPLRNGHIISLYPVTLPVLVAPLYLPAVAYLELRGWTESRLAGAARLMEKIAASLIASASAALFYLLLRRRATEGVSLLLTVAFAFGTTTWMIGSQALWQHGMGELLVIASLLLLTSRPSPSMLFAAGVMLGLIAANRPPDVIIAAALSAYGVFRTGRRCGFLIAGGALIGTLLMLYNLGIAGHFAGGYGRVGDATFFDNNLLHGLAGHLFSPTRGLFVFSPFLLFLVLGWRHRPRVRDERALTLAMAAAVIIQLLVYSKADWRTGISWGPRFLTDLLPLLVWMLVPVAAALKGALRLSFIGAIILAVAIEGIGAIYYTGETDAPILDVKSGPDRFAAAWDWRNAPFVAPLKAGPAPRDLAITVSGSVDALTSNGRTVSEITPGEPLSVSGWAAVEESSPAAVLLMADGRVLGAADTFLERHDVEAAIGISAPSGWSVALDTSGLSPKTRAISAFVRTTEGGPYYVGSRSVTVRPSSAGKGTIPEPPEKRAAPRATAPDLANAFSTAAARIREHQQTQGYWLTKFTSGTRYVEPGREMNTFLTASLVDLLAPLGETGLKTALERARRHLTEQIEPGGLVRYHGLPVGPGMGVLGCAITPDTDDTALVWRIAPGSDRRELDAALRTISQYRTDEGLYRTWLSPPAGYQCLNPGSDPNPPDMAIQMHLLLLLAKERPADARALCTTLRRVVDEDRVWVYYAVTPLVAMLRLPDVARAGCPLQLPESRRKTGIAEQEIWVSVVDRIIRAEDQKPSDAPAIRALLETLAADDFSLLRKTPPLLYHNDLTASVSRYYWSEDFGYALWMRLAAIHADLRRTDAPR